MIKVTPVHYHGKGHVPMSAVAAGCPSNPEPEQDRWDFEPAAEETFAFDPHDDRKWDVFLLEDDDLDPLPEEVGLS